MNGRNLNKIAKAYKCKVVRIWTSNEVYVIFNGRRYNVNTTYDKSLKWNAQQWHEVLSNITGIKLNEVWKELEHKA